jgi:hypothetical protein
MSKLNKEYFETKKKYNNGIRKKTTIEKVLFLSISILIAVVFIYFNSSKSEKDKTIQDLNAIELNFVKKDTIVETEIFSILVPNNFGFTVDYSGLSIFSRKLEDKNFAFFVIEKNLIDGDLMKTYSKTLLGSENKYDINSKYKLKDEEVFNLNINDNSKGLVRLIRLDDNKMYIVHVSSPNAVWNENLGIKIINSFVYKR